MNSTTRILIVEDLVTDYELAQREIRKSVEGCIFQRVETQDECEAALKEFQPDVIISDMYLPRFSGTMALQISRQHAPLSPLIIWTGSISEDIAAECLIAGAANYVSKQNLKRLGPAVLRAVEQRQLMLENQQAQELILNLARFPEENPNPVLRTTQNGTILYTNSAGHELLELWNTSVGNVLPPEWQNAVQEAFAGHAEKPIDVKVHDQIYSIKIAAVRDLGYVNLYGNDITERRQAEEKYLAIVEDSPVGIFQSSPQGRFINVNSAMARIYGYSSPGEMLSSITDIASQIYPEPQERGVFRRLLETQGTVQGFELKNIRKDGSLFWTSTTARLVRDDSGNILYYEGFLQDITDRKLADERLAASEKRFRALIENGMDSISLLAEDGTLLWENPSVNRALGYLPDEFINRNIFQLMHPEDAAWVSELFTKLVSEKNTTQHAIFRLKHHDDTWRWIEANATNMISEPSIGAVVVNYRDITERRHAEEKLRESQSKYRNLVESSHDLIWAVDADANFTFLNRAAKDIYGFEPEELVGRSFFEIMDPRHFHNNLELFRKNISLIKEQKAVETYVRHRDGRQIVLSANSIVIRDDNGNVLGVTGSSRDITESKYATDKLRESEERYRLLFENNPLPMWIFDRETLGFLKVNEAAINHYGYSRDEFLSMTIKDIRPSEDISRLLENVANSAARGQRIGREGIWRHIKKDGTTIRVEIISHPLEFEGRKAELILATDITQRYEAELEIQQRNDDLALINSLNEVISQGLGVDAVVSLLRKEIKRIFGGEGVAIYLLSPDGKSLKMQQYLFQPETSKKIEQLIGRSVPAIEIPIREGGYFHEVLASERGRITSDPATIQKWMEEFIETAYLPRMARGPIRALLPSIFKLLNIKSTMMAPLVWEGRTIGLLDISGPGIFIEDDLRRIENICAQLTIAIHRYQMEELLTKERNLLRTLIDNVPDRIYVMDTEGRKTLSNTADWKASGGKTMQDVIGKTDFETYPPELAEPFWTLDREVLDTGKPIINYEEPGLDLQGNRVSILTTKIPLRNEEGKIIGLVGVGRDITERKRSEARINDLLVFNEKVLNNSPVGILTYKLSGECTFANEKAAFIIGTNIETLLTENFHALESWKKSGLYVLVQKAIASKTVAMGDIHHISTFGRDVWLAAHCITFSLHEEEHVLLSLSDITERKRAEDELRQKNEDLWLLNVVNNAVVRGQDLDSIMQLLTKELKRIFSALGSSIYMLSEDKRMLTMEQYSFAPETEHKIEKLIGFRIPKIEIPIKEGGHFHDTLLAKQSAITSDPPKIREWITEFADTKSLPPLARAAVRKLIPQIYKLLNIRSTIIVPLISQEDVIGFLHVAGVNLFTSRDLKRIETIGEQLTSLIQRQQAIDKVHKSEKFLQSVQNALSAHIAILDEEGTIIQVNSAWCKFAEQNGLEHPNYGIGLNYLEICDSATGSYSAEGPLVAKAIREVIAGLGTETWVEYPAHSSNENRWFVLRITKFDDGDHLRVVLAHENITDRKQMEAKLQASETRYRLATLATKDVIWEWNPKDNRLIWTENAQTAFGYSPEEVGPEETWWDDHLHPEDRQRVLSTINKAMAGTGSVWSEQYRFLLKDGSYAYVNDHGYIERDSNGKVTRLIGAMSNITDRKQAEEELRRSHSLLQTTLESTADGILVVAQDGKISSFNQKFLELWQIPDHLAMQKDDRALLSFVINQVKDPQAFISKVESLYTSPEAVSHDELEFLDGRVFERYSQPQRLGNTILGRVWSFRDVTQRKQAEEALREGEEKYRVLFESNPLPMWIYDLESLRFLKVNGSAIDHYGYTENEFMTMTIKDIRPPVDVPGLLQNISQVSNEIDKAGVWNHVIKDGSIIEVEIVSHMVEFDGRRAELVLANDVTERKRAENELRTSEERFRQLATNIEEAFWITDVQAKREVYISPAAATIWGHSVEHFMQTPDAFLNSVLDEDLPIVHASLERQSKGEKTEMEYRITRPDGSIRWIWDRAFPIFDENGKVTRLAGIAADITPRKQSEIEIQRHLTELEALYENGLTIGRLLEPREVGNQIIQTFARHLSWHHVAIRLLNLETNKLELIAFNQPGLSNEARAEIESRFNRMVSNVGQGLSGLAMQTGVSIRMGNVHTHPQYVDTHEGIMSGLYMPLKVGDRIIGCISVESDLSDAFTQQDERLLATLANQASIAFENARLYQAAQLEISERRRTQEALWISENHYRQLADSITDILFELDQDLRYTHWNKASEMFSGIPAEDAIGRSMRDVFGSAESQLEREAVYRGVLRDRQARSFETQVIVKGQKRYLEINAYPSAHGVSVVAKDITERRLAAMLMQKRFELMEYAANHSLDEVMQRAIDEICELTGSPIGFFNFIEEDQKTVHLSAWSSETLKVSEHSIPMGAHFPLDKAGPWTDAVQQRRPLIHNDPESIKATGALPEDHPPLIRDMMIPVIRHERLIGIIGTANKTQDYTQHDLNSAERLADYAWDIIERKEMETELAEERNQLAQRVEERTADLSRANSNLARALRVKDEFLANMSHELRTPLNAILGLSESLGELVAGPLNEKQQKYLFTINESGHHLLSLINDILDLAKIEAGQISLDINKVDVNSVCQASLRMIKQLAQRKNQEVNFEIEPGIGLMWADERRLKQMIVNLLSNAVKFTPDSGALGLEVRGDQAGNKISISVWDRGIGVSDNDMPRLFKPFVQLDSGLAREAAGTGLGLALVAQMAKLHGGSVTVESQPGHGSRFTIMLPWEPAVAGESNSRLRSSSKFRAIKPDEVRPTVLLIEDTREVVMMLVDYLEMAGFNMVTAQDGIDGLTQAKIAHPDLILMDIQMPRMDGFETTKKLRSDPEFKETPIIALTALAMPNDRRRCLDAGMNEYLSKPVNLKALSKTIKAFLYDEEANQS